MHGQTQIKCPGYVFSLGEIRLREREREREREGRERRVFKDAVIC